MSVPPCIMLRLMVVAALLMAACSNDTVEPLALDDPAEFASERLDADEAAPAPPEGESTVPEPATTTPDQTPGSVVDEFSLGVGDCFNRRENLAAGGPAVITSLVDCDLPHDHQIYHILDYPAPHPSIYPGDTVMDSFAVQSCYREFSQWVGNDYETSELDFGVITPPQVNFEDDASRYRSIHCWVEQLDGEPLVGDAHQSGW